MPNDISTPPATTLSEPPSPTELAEYRSNRRPSNNPFNYPPVYHDDSDEEERARTPMAPSATAIVKTTRTTIVPITFHPKPIYVIVATALNPPMGIGNAGTLPWPGIKADMAFFRQLTSRVPESAKYRNLNALIMGRKTWESIPSKFRPFTGRLNVVITKGKVKELGRRILEELQASSHPTSNSWEAQDLLLSASTTPSRAAKDEGTGDKGTLSSNLLLTPSSSALSSAVLVSSSLTATLSLLSSSETLPNTSISPQKLFCIGGATLYEQVLALSHSPHTDDEDEDLSPTATRERQTDTDSVAFDVRVLQTQVHKINGEEFACDTFFPEDLTYTHATSPWRAVGSRTLESWVDGVEIPGSASASSTGLQGNEDTQADDDENDDDGWARDDKAGVEFRVVGWERR